MQDDEITKPDNEPVALDDRPPEVRVVFGGLYDR